MKDEHLPPLLRGIGTTIVLIATVVSVLFARKDVQTERVKHDAIHAKAEAAAKAQPDAARNLAELKVDVDELRSELQEESVTDEVIKNPWFEWASFFGTATIAGSFYVESSLKRRGKLIR